MKVTDALLGEHAVFYAQFDACEQTIDRAELPSLRLQAALITSALQSHAQLEDTLLFDGLRSSAGMPTLFAVMEQEHGVIAGMLAQIQTVRAVADARELLRDIIHTARDHFAKEERVAFPLAEQLLGSAEMVRLGERWAAARGVSLGEPLPAV